jgi:excisionase family DNA binding protein
MAEITNSGLAEREWMDLKAVTRYASISERTLREWIHRALNPLPAVRVGTKILIRRTVFDQWLETHPLVPAESVDVRGIAGEILAELVGTD